MQHWQSLALLAIVMRKHTKKNNFSRKTDLREQVPKCWWAAGAQRCLRLAVGGWAAQGAGDPAPGGYNLPCGAGLWSCPELSLGQKDYCLPWAARILLQLVPQAISHSEQLGSLVFLSRYFCSHSRRLPRSKGLSERRRGKAGSALLQVSNHLQRFHQLLRRSCCLHGAQILVLGWGSGGDLFVFLQSKYPQLYLGICCFWVIKGLVCLEFFYSYANWANEKYFFYL